MMHKCSQRRSQGFLVKGSSKNLGGARFHLLSIEYIFSGGGGSICPGYASECSNYSVILSLEFCVVIIW
jgi:hypothetical protein